MNGRPAASASSRETSAARAETCDSEAPASAAVKVGSSRASRSPACTLCPSATSMERTIEVSSGCTTSAGTRDTTFPGAVTARSTGISPMASRHAAKRPPIAQIVPRARSGTFPALIAEDADENSRITGSVASSCVCARLAAPAERWDKSRMTEPLTFDVTILLAPELAVGQTPLQQRAVRADIDRSPFVQHKDLLAVDQGRQTVARDAKQVGVEQRLAFRIEGARRLVENEDARIGDQRTGDREPLSLSAQEVGRSLLDQRLIAVRHALDEFLGAGQAGRPHGVVQRQPGTTGDDVVSNGAAEQEVVLQHNAQAAAQVAQVDGAQFGAVDSKETVVVPVDPLQQPGQRRLAGPAAPDDAQHGAGRNLEADAIKRRKPAAGVGETHVIKRYGAGKAREKPTVCGFG